MQKDKNKIDWSSLSFIIIISLLVVMYTIHHNDSFFGAKVVSTYIGHFDNKMKCAYVSGWKDEPKCMCILVEDDPRIKDKTLLVSHNKMCEFAQEKWRN
jgi:hypothetical protein